MIVNIHCSFDTDAISIRLGKKLERAQVAQNQVNFEGYNEVMIFLQSPFNTLSQWHCICIEEPFTLSNAAHSVYDERIFQEIKNAFADSYHELDKNRDLESFLGKSIEENKEENQENGTDEEQSPPTAAEIASPKITSPTELECCSIDDIIDEESLNNSDM